MEVYRHTQAIIYSTNTTASVVCGCECQTINIGNVFNTVRKKKMIASYGIYILIEINNWPWPYS